MRGVLLIGAAILAIFASLSWPIYTETYNDGRVSAGYVSRLYSQILVHHSRPKWLKVCGKTFNGIRGESPFYLALKEMSAILFVTEHQGVVHINIVSLDTC